VAGRWPARRAASMPAKGVAGGKTQPLQAGTSSISSQRSAAVLAAVLDWLTHQQMCLVRAIVST
jgi:hypothetical protein